MKKVFDFSIIVAIIIAVLLLYFDQSRKYFCISEDKCVTVWKRIGGTCYIVPDKYTGWFKPKDDFIRTSNLSNLDIVWIDQFPNSIIIKQQSYYQYIIVNKNKNNLHIYRYENDSDTFHSLIYNIGAKNYSDIKAGVFRLSIDVRENYARTSDGRILR